MRRRDFIAGFTGLAAVSPLVARAQQAAMPVVGIISSGSPAEYGNFVAAFRQGLKEAGYVEGKNLAIEYRWAEGHYDRLPSPAADLVNRTASQNLTHAPFASGCAIGTSRQHPRDRDHELMMERSD
jgi:putative tryptophan/tyrosine transport system substrate-binding protein